jgi:hypothetical protein
MLLVKLPLVWYPCVLVLQSYGIILCSLCSYFVLVFPCFISSLHFYCHSAWLFLTRFSFENWVPQVLLCVRDVALIYYFSCTDPNKPSLQFSCHVDVIIVSEGSHFILICIHIFVLSLRIFLTWIIFMFFIFTWVYFANMWLCIYLLYLRTFRRQLLTVTIVYHTRYINYVTRKLINL